VGGDKKANLEANAKELMNHLKSMAQDGFVLDLPLLLPKMDNPDELERCLVRDVLCFLELYFSADLKGFEALTGISLSSQHFDIIYDVDREQTKHPIRFLEITSERQCTLSEVAAEHQLFVQDLRHMLRHPETWAGFILDEDQQALKKALKRKGRSAKYLDPGFAADQPIPANSVVFILITKAHLKHRDPDDYTGLVKFATSLDWQAHFSFCAVHAPIRVFSSIVYRLHLVRFLRACAPALRPARTRPDRRCAVHTSALRLPSGRLDLDVCRAAAKDDDSLLPHRRRHAPRVQGQGR
jgi:hypothetical protein